MMRVQAGLGAAALGAISAMACGTGSGPLPGSAVGREGPPATRDAPPATRDDPNGPCLQCNVQYFCVDSNNPNKSFSLMLSSQNGSCTQASIDYFCSSGAAFGATSCSILGGGAFSCGSVICSPPGG
jgi:hypothetical protein